MVTKKRINGTIFAEWGMSHPSKESAQRTAKDIRKKNPNIKVRVIKGTTRDEKGRYLVYIEKVW